MNRPESQDGFPADVADAYYGREDDLADYNDAEADDYRNEDGDQYDEYDGNEYAEYDNE